MPLQLLVVDDDPLFTKIHSHLIRHVGMEMPLTMNNGQEAIQYFKTCYQRERVYLVFLDINMPVANGWDVLDYITGMSAPNIYVVVVSSSIQRIDRERSLSYPNVIDYAIKPVQRTRFEELKRSFMGDDSEASQGKGLPA